jgi:predicted amidophosphoribosyltransferase
VPEGAYLFVAIEINPRRLRGPWDDGYALDAHTRSSTFFGYDSFGHPRFDTVRSPVGELLYRLKYVHDRAAIGPLADAIQSFLGMIWKPPIQAIVPVPPSVSRTDQPVLLIGTALSERLGIPLCPSCISKVKRTPQLKDLVEYDKRVAALKDAFAVGLEQTKGRSLLVFDDLHGSGATVRAIAELLKTEGQAKAVYLLTLTTK